MMDLCLWLLLFLPGTPASPFYEDLNLYESGGSLDDSHSALYDIFMDTPDLRVSQDVGVLPGEYQVDTSTELENLYNLDTVYLAADGMSPANPDILFSDLDTIASGCSPGTGDPIVKTRRNIWPEWFPQPEWSPWPTKDPSPGSDFCVYPKEKAEQLEIDCGPDESLCCKGRANWVDDSSIVIVQGCIRCMSHSVFFLPPPSFLSIPTWWLTKDHPCEDTSKEDCDDDGGVKWCCGAFYSVRSLPSSPLPMYCDIIKQNVSAAQFDK